MAIDRVKSSHTRGQLYPCQVALFCIDEPHQNYRAQGGDPRESQRPCRFLPGEKPILPVSALCISPTSREYFLARPPDPGELATPMAWGVNITRKY